jgi:hypothetical protein
LLLLRQTSILNFPRRCPHTFQFTGYTGWKSRIFTDTADLGTGVTTREDKIHFCYFHLSLRQATDRKHLGGSPFLTISRRYRRGRTMSYPELASGASV